MAINQLGRLNFAGLSNYLIRPQDMDLFEQYLEAYVKELIAQGRGAGLVYGGAIVPVSGLTFTVQKSLWVTSAGQLFTVDDTNLTLAAADPSNPRIDRIEVAYSLANGTTVQDVNGINEILDKKHVGTYSINKGTASGTPSANNTTVGNLSVGLISLAAGQNTIVAANIDQSEVATDHARNAASRQFSAPIANNQPSGANAPVVGMAFSSVKTKAARVRALIYRYDGITERITIATIFAKYYPAAGQWKLDWDYEGDDPSMDFKIGATSGQVQYSSDNMPGGSYTGTIYFSHEFF